jgi:hypothetical protein
VHSSYHGKVIIEMHAWIGQWPVTDPEIPREDRERILGNPAFSGVPRYAGNGGSSEMRAFQLILLLIAEGVFFGIMCVVALAVDPRAFLVAALGSAAVFVLSAIRGGIWVSGTSTDRLRRLYRNRYVMANELDGEAHALLQRTRNAIGRIYSSRVHRAGLLDAVANDLILPRQLYEIAWLLRFQTNLRHEQAAARRGVMTPELHAVLEPQRRALERSVADVTERVEKLERYAHNTQEADAALRAQDLLRSNDKYRYLLAHTDDAQGMHYLAAQAGVVEDTLARTVTEAIQTGQTLAIPHPPPDANPYP